MNEADAKVDAFLRGEVKRHNSRTQAHLERALPEHLIQKGSRMNTVSSGLIRLSIAGELHLWGGAWCFRPGVKK